MLKKLLQLGATSEKLKGGGKQTSHFCASGSDFDNSSSNKVTNSDCRRLKTATVLTWLQPQQQED